MSDQTVPVIGLALGSGAARGWAHVGVLRALDELGVEVGVIAGCSVGALVGGAHLLGTLEDFMTWARSLSPLGAMRDFQLGLNQGGLINPAPAFEAFRHADKPIEELPLPFGATATCLASGEEVWITSGSTIDAARASSAIPTILEAAKVEVKGEERWFLDGALSNPVPVDLARKLGASHVIAVDLNAVSRTVERFNRPTSRAIVPVDTDAARQEAATKSILPDQVALFLEDTRRYVDHQVALAKARSASRPKLLETAIAALDIFQTNLGDARAELDKPDIRLTPDMRDHDPTAFDAADEMIEVGYEVTMAEKDAILGLKA